MDPFDKPSVIVFSHAGFLDVYLSFMHLEKSFYNIGKKELFNIPILGSVLRSTKGIEINRSSIKDAIGSLKAAEDKIKEGNSLMIAPEGKRRRKRSIDKESNLLEFKKGPFHIAKNTKTRILPIVYTGVSRANPGGSVIFKKANVYGRLCKPIEVDTVEKMTVDELADYTCKYMCESTILKKDEEIFRPHRNNLLWVIGYCIYLTSCCWCFVRLFGFLFNR